jgi:hypothetical protein
VESRATVVFGNKPQSWLSALKSLGRGGWGARQRFLSRLDGAMNEHDRDIWGIALPSLVGLVVDPFLSIVDTGYIGR